MSKNSDGQRSNENPQDNQRQIEKENIEPPNEKHNNPKNVEEYNPEISQQDSDNQKIYNKKTG